MIKLFRADFKTRLRAYFMRTDVRDRLNWVVESILLFILGTIFIFSVVQIVVSLIQMGAR